MIARKGPFRVTEKLSPRLYADRTARRHRDHRDLDFALAPRRSAGARGGPSHAVPQYSQTTCPGLAELSRRGADVSAGPDAEHLCRQAEVPRLHAVRLL